MNEQTFHHARRLFQLRHALEAMYMPAHDRHALGELAMNLERKLQTKPKKFTAQ